MNYLKNIQNEAKFHARTLITIVNYLESDYGKETVESFKNYWFQEVFYKPWKEISKANPNNLQTFVKILEDDCTGTHEWIKEIDEPKRIKYKFTKCVWANVFHEFGMPDIGKWFCESDYMICKAFNPKIKFKRTKTLMDKDDCCDHEFFLEE
ncbi:MAG: L-2-amino-thiazoline-4-carboxylic acid hydrolase [Candidatus Aenigmarchaeota archaeon]|nr:L-2-amino-thiazoline-4-carboxylic acid hydrolase [Candidatus Aenigmarchaeota archaeon]